MPFINLRIQLDCIIGRSDFDHLQLPHLDPQFKYHQAAAQFSYQPGESQRLWECQLWVAMASQCIHRSIAKSKKSPKKPRAALVAPRCGAIFASLEMPMRLVQPWP